jgi:hypothetical protein
MTHLALMANAWAIAAALLFFLAEKIAKKNDHR